MEPLRSQDEIATYLNVPVRTLTQWRFKRTGPTYLRLGKYVRYRQSDVDRWLAEQTESA